MNGTVEGAGTEMPRYRCHKEVHAVRITNLSEMQGWLEVQDAEKGGAKTQIRVGADWMVKHTPEIGGYLVVYEDGYRSYSPRKAFEEGYTRI